MSGREELLGEWENAKSRLAEVLPQEKMEKWIDIMDPVSMSPTEIKFRVPNDFYRDWLKDNYASVITETTGRNVKIDTDSNYLIPSTEEPQVRASEKVKKPKRGRLLAGSRLNPYYTIDNFVQGPLNGPAYSAAMSVIERAGEKVWGPMIFHGSNGLGKTHLMHAIGHEWIKSPGGLIVASLSAERYLNEYVDTFSNRSTNRFRDKYRQADLLLIDEIDFLDGKKGVQKEFLNMYNTLLEQGKQIVMTANELPSQCDFNPALASRLQSGLIVSIDGSDYESRIGVMKKVLDETEGAYIRPELLEYIAKNIHTDHRKLEGAVRRIICHQGFSGKRFISEGEVLGVANDLFDRPLTPNGLAEILEGVANEFDTSIEELGGKERSKKVVTPRQIAMYLATKANHSLTDIGGALNKNHATISYGAKKIEEQMQEDDTLRQNVYRLANAHKIQL